MAEDSSSASEATGEKLVDIFQNGLTMYEELVSKRNSSTDAELETDVKKCMKQFELATQLVSAAALFSSNETLEDISTETLKYLLLPALLGMLSLRLISISRHEIVEIAQIYFKDFIKRCKEYSITDIEIPSNDEEKKKESADPMEALQATMTSREEKIKRYNKEKELDSKITELKAVIQNENVDDGSKREYYLALIEYHLMKAVEELNYIKAELPLIEMMEKAKSQNINPEKAVPKKAPPKLQPFIITKNDIQKAIFGQGYPSLPIYTVEEFYDQRQKEGIFPGPDSCKKPAPKINLNADETDPSDLVDGNKDKLVDDDDSEQLEKARRMDEFKDDHKRGEGNRYNMS